MRYTRKNLIIILLLCVTLVGIGTVFFLQRPRPQPSTGGSGVADPGYVILTGYETRSNDTSKIKLGSFLSSDQQTKIRLFMSAVLFEKNPKTVYEGVIAPGSFTVDYQTSVLTFKIDIKDPKSTYTVSFRTLDDTMTVLDENGQPLTPTVNPDGTPFTSFRSSSQLAP